MGQVPGLNLRRTHKITPNLTAESFEVSPKNGEGFVRVKFEHQLNDGTTREFATDLARLEYIEKRAAEYAASGSREEKQERVGDVDVWFLRKNFENRGEAVGVQLAQKHPDDPSSYERLHTFADNFAAAVREAKSHEQELGLDARWQVLVNANSLTKDEAGRIHAQAVASVESETKARELLGKSTGLALYSVTQPHELSKGETLELWPAAEVLVQGEHQAITAEQQLGKAEHVREQRAEHYLVAKWTNESQGPILDQPTTWRGHGDAYNGHPDDFRAGPIVSGDPGQTNEPLWVLIERGDRFGKGRIVGFSNDRGEMNAELARLETRVQEMSRDFQKQSFQMDRKQFTRGHSM